jgi:hypothetical protein
MSKFPLEAFVPVTFYLPFLLQVLNKSCLQDDVLLVLSASGEESSGRCTRV